ncbi:hypothetical protein EGW08_013220 [Elysia chlorotica]|uniref:Uncharacterized protein n=1 Tax=Elysia chlorotica TaxID=188477 RepID=A0A3S1HGP6_ELYCH|nr:hypothetical protein EGW08_013220 [Elysia chlorotica]
MQCVPIETDIISSSWIVSDDSFNNNNNDNTISTHNDDINNNNNNSSNNNKDHSSTICAFSDSNDSKDQPCWCVDNNDDDELGKGATTNISSSRKLRCEKLISNSVLATDCLPHSDSLGETQHRRRQPCHHRAPLDNSDLHGLTAVTSDAQTTQRSPGFRVEDVELKALYSPAEVSSDMARSIGSMAGESPRSPALLEGTTSGNLTMTKVLPQTDPGEMITDLNINSCFEAENCVKSKTYRTPTAPNLSPVAFSGEAQAFSSSGLQAALAYEKYTPCSTRLSPFQAVPSFIPAHGQWECINGCAFNSSCRYCGHFPDALDLHCATVAENPRSRLFEIESGGDTEARTAAVEYPGDRDIVATGVAYLGHVTFIAIGATFRGHFTLKATRATYLGYVTFIAIGATLRGHSTLIATGATYLGHVTLIAIGATFRGHFTLKATGATYLGHVTFIAIEATFRGHVTLKATGATYLGHVTFIAIEATFRGHVTLIAIGATCFGHAYPQYHRGPRYLHCHRGHISRPRYPHCHRGHLLRPRYPQYHRGHISRPLYPQGNRGHLLRPLYSHCHRGHISRPFHRQGHLI